MNTIRTFTCTALLASLAACSNTTPPAAPAASSTAAQPTSSLGKLVGKEIEEARKKLATENIGLNGSIRLNAGKDGDVAVFDGADKSDTRPKGEITPKGDLLIDGKAVAINAEQRAMLLEYRAHVIKVAEGGMDIGLQGADLAVNAMGEAFKGVLSGKSEQEIEKVVEAEAADIKAAVVKLCEDLPPMMETQRKLAAALPEFKPYANMTREDIDDCLKNGEGDGQQAGARAEIREEIRGAVRESVREEVRQVVRNDGAQEQEAKPSR